MNSQILRTILEADGPAKRTRAKIKRCLVPMTTENPEDGAGPSGTSNDPMDLSEWFALWKWWFRIVAKTWLEYISCSLCIIIVFYNVVDIYNGRHYCD
jgi:hypothetical protein